MCVCHMCIKVPPDLLTYLEIHTLYSSAIRPRSASVTYTGAIFAAVEMRPYATITIVICYNTTIRHRPGRRQRT